MDIEKIEAEARYRWLEQFSEQFGRGEYLSKAQVAEQLGKPEIYVTKKHAEGALYVQKIPRDYVEKLAAAFPERMEKIKLAVEFVRQGQEMVYPAWQLREKRKPSDGRKVIRAEVKMAREAFVLYAQELSKYMPTHQDVVSGKATDSNLVSFFSATGGFSGHAVQDHIARLDKARPADRLTVDKLKGAWEYHRNPFCDFLG